MYLPRRLEPIILRLSSSFPVIILTGPRQSGKTSLLEHLREKGRGFVSLDDLDLRRLAREDPKLFMAQFPPPLVIDEFQYAPDLLPYIKIAVDSLRTTGRSQEANGMYWLTGSQQFALMEGVRESLAGRAAIINLLGMDPAESLGLGDSGHPKSFFQRQPDELQSWEVSTDPLAVFERIICGSMPAVATRPHDDEFRRRFYSSYIQTYLERDIASLEGVRNLRQFELFFRLLAARAGGLVNHNELSKEVGVSAVTIKAWTGILERSFHIATIPPYYRSLSKRLVKTPKIYFLDSGLHAYLTGWQDAETALKGPLAGALLENWAAGLLIRSNWHRGRENRLSFWRTSSGEEIDFWDEYDARISVAECKLAMGGLAEKAQKQFKPLDGLDPHPALFGRKYMLSLGASVMPLGKDTWEVPLRYVD